MSLLQGIPPSPRRGDESEKSRKKLRDILMRGRKSVIFSEGSQDSSSRSSDKGSVEVKTLERDGEREMIVRNTTLGGGSEKLYFRV
jgi:hypothetical protein